ncbi:MAG TPA: FtsX-like permease family protein, partial [Draconibacterium sp.]|nr:FtsX-like permease family protein [Draconibacterium sp.]
TPKNSTIQFDFALSYDAWMDLSRKVGREIGWGNHAPCTYLVLKENTDIKQFNAKIENYLETKSGNSSIKLFIVPFSSQYLHGKFENGVQTGGRISYVSLFSLIAVFIILIAGVNFMNLTTARASGRFKEIGIKKVVGSGRGRLIVQFVSESVLLTFLALLVSLGIVYLMLPLFNQITAKNLVFSSHLQFFLILPLIAFLLAVITGLYPALYLSGFNGLQTLKAKFSNQNGEIWARKGLVVFQFVISVVLIISVIVIHRQVEFIRNKNLGYNKNHVVFFDREGEIANHQEAFLQEAGKIPGVINISSVGGTLIGSFASTYDVSWPEKEPGSNIQFEVIPVNYNLIETLEMELAEGRSFSAEFKNDKEKIILNEKAVEIMGLKDPIGKTIRFWGNDRQVVGVLKNFNFESLKEEINPLLFYLDPDKTMKIMARIEAGQEAKVLKALATVYGEFNTGFQFDYQFMDAVWNAQYEAETRVGILSRLFAVLGIFISCLGLFGLASFAAEKRIKEIGVRKVNGAKISEVMGMLNKEFVQWVFIAFVIATPVAWYILHKWLESYVYKTTLSWWIFALAGILALGIALLTVSWQSWRAATRNPVEALRYE